MIDLLLVFGSSPSIRSAPFPAQVLVGEIDDLSRVVRELGFDGLEYLPDPLELPDPDELLAVMRQREVAIPIINSGRMHQHQLALMHQDQGVRRDAMEAYRGLIALAGRLGANVGLGMARGASKYQPSDTDSVIGDVLDELGDAASEHQTQVLVEPIPTRSVIGIGTMREAVQWLSTIGNGGLGLMLDTIELMEDETRPAEAISLGVGARHIQLYDPGYWPPGCLPEQDAYDWAVMVKSLKSIGFQGTGAVVPPPFEDRWLGDPEVNDALVNARRFVREAFE